LATALTFSPDGDFLVLASHGNKSKMRLLDNTGKKIRKLDALGPWRKCDTNALAFSPDGNILACGTSAGVMFFDLEMNKCIHAFGGRCCRAVAFGRDGKIFAFGNFQTVEVWNLETNVLIHTFICGNWPHALAFNSDGNILVFCGGNRDPQEVKICNLATSTCTHLFGVPPVAFTAMYPPAAAFSSDGNFLALGDVYGKVWLWDVRTQAHIRELQCQPSHIIAVALNSNGSRIAAGGLLEYGWINILQNV
jgi:WD40 repeat protein